MNGKIFRLKNENEIKRAENKTIKGVCLARYEFPRWHPDVIRDINYAIELKSKIEDANDKKILGMFVFGGVVRRPEVSHKNSDIDLLLIKEDGARLKAFKNDDFRVSLFIYPFKYLSSQLQSPTEEGSFLRNVFAQGKLKLIDHGVIDILQRTAEDNYQEQDIIRLVYHLLRKGQKNGERRSIREVLEEVGLIDKKVFPCSKDDPIGFFEKGDKVYYVTGCYLCDDFIWAYPVKHGWEMRILPRESLIGYNRIDADDGTLWEWINEEYVGAQMLL